MNTFLLNRAVGSVSHQALSKAHHDQLVHSLRPASNVIVSYKDYRHQTETDEGGDDAVKTAIAHPAGVNSITVDKFEGR